MDIVAARKKFRVINICAIVALFVLILAGGVVRSTGAGMGCPDWPKCFGQYIPPTDASQIPSGYKEKYVAKRLQKNIHFAHTLDVFGYAELANRIRNDKSILVPEDFNVTKTWTEYINRLVGMLSGLLLLATAVYAFAYWRIKPQIVVLSVFNVLLVGFQAWLGSIVVSTNLVPWVVTLHMLLALAILAICIYTYHSARIAGLQQRLKVKSAIWILVILSVILSVIQITIGTEVREKIDDVAAHLQGQARELWVIDSGEVFYNHRELSLLILLVNVALYALVRKAFSRHSAHQQLMSFNFLMLMLQMGTGIALSYWDLPPFAQAAHIVLASLLFGAQFYLLLNLYKSAKA